MIKHRHNNELFLPYKNPGLVMSVTFGNRFQWNKRRIATELLFYL